MITTASEAQGLSVIAKGGIINLIGLFLSLVLNLGYQFILVRLLSPADVGIFNLGLTITGIIGLIIIFGVDRAAVRQIAYFAGKKEKGLELGVVSSAVMIMLIMTVIVIPVCYLLADQLAEFIFKKPDLSPILKILLISVPFAMFTRLAMGFLQAYKLMKPLVLIEQIIIPILRIFVTIILILFFSRTLAGISISYAVTAMIGCAVAVAAFRHYYLNRKGSSKPQRSYQELLIYAWPFLGASLLNRTNTYTETLILGGFSSSEQVGLFSVSFKLAVTLTIIFQAINTVLAPFIAEMFAKSDHSKLSYQFKAVTRWGFTLALPFGLLLCINAYDILAILNPEYLAGVPVLQTLSLAQLVYIIVGPVALILSMTNYVRLNLVDLMITLILSIGLDLLLIPRYGAYGAAIAGVISIIFINLLRLIQVYRLFGIHPYNTGYLKPLGASGIAFLAFIGVSHLMEGYSHLIHLLVTSGVFIFVYAAFILLFRMDDMDRKVLGIIFRDAFTAQGINQK